MARRLLLCCLLLLAPLTGCTAPSSDQPAPPPGDSQEPPGEEDQISCDRAVLPGNREGQQGKLLYLSCDGQGPGVQRATVSCPDPAGAELSAGAELTGGQLQISVQDADGHELVNRTVSDTGGSPREVTMNNQGAEPGTWTAWVQRAEGYEGEHRVELWCPGG